MNVYVHICACLWFQCTNRWVFGFWLSAVFVHRLIVIAAEPDHHGRSVSRSRLDWNRSFSLLWDNWVSLYPREVQLECKMGTEKPQTTSWTNSRASICFHIISQGQIGVKCILALKQNEKKGNSAQLVLSFVMRSRFWSEMNEIRLQTSQWRWLYDWAVCV